MLLRVFGVSTKISERVEATYPLTGKETIPVIQGGVDRRTVLGIGSVVTPEHFGAVGDGVTDDTDAIQDALDSGAEGVFAKNLYLTTATLELQPNQVLFGLPKTNQIEDSAAMPTGIKFVPGGADKVAIKNATGADSCGVKDLAISCNDDSHTALQFSATYGNIAQGIHFYGRMRLGVLLDDTYVVNLDRLIFNGALVRTACVFVGDCNATTISKLHTSNLPEDVSECMYGVAWMDSGYANSMIDCIIQGPTIGIATHEVRELAIINPYFENTLCNARFANAAGGGDVITIHGGKWSAPSGSHSQYASRGPVIYTRSMQNLTMIGPGFEVTADNTTSAGPWPIVSAGCRRLTVINPFHFNGTTETYGRDLLYREAAGSNIGVYMVTDYSGHHAQEIIMKTSGAFGSGCVGLRVDSAGVLSGESYAPAVIFAAINALLTTDLPAASTLVL